MDAKDALGELIEACEEALQFATDQSDVIDGSYGEPRPNRAAQIESRLLAALAVARAAYAV